MAICMFHYSLEIIKSVIECITKKNIDNYKYKRQGDVT